MALAVSVAEADLQGPGRAEFSSMRRWVTSGNSSAIMAAVPSVVPLSITAISATGRSWAPQPLEGPPEHVAALEGDHDRGPLRFSSFTAGSPPAPPAARLRGTASRTLRTRRPDSPSVRAGRPSLTAAAAP